MSVKYQPVQWTGAKLIYDAILVGVIAAYILIFLYVVPEFGAHTRTIDAEIAPARAFGTCAFLLVTVILAIGPLARLDSRFLPLLYNRRHFGVITFLVALTHAYYAIDWYFAFAEIPKFTAIFAANVNYGQVLGFPFETPGVLALLALAILAATSHDFWLKFLTPRLWKGLHYLLYFAFALIVVHVALGSLQSQKNQTFTIIVGLSLLLVCALHAIAAFREHQAGGKSDSDGDWYKVGAVAEIEEGRAKIVNIGVGRRVAVFRHNGRLSAIANACAHQNGPLGEGRIIDDCVTCPWHGFQYRLADGRAPPPFTEKVETYTVRLDGTTVWVNGAANALGTTVSPVVIPENVT